MKPPNDYDDTFVRGNPVRGNYGVQGNVTALQNMQDQNQNQNPIGSSGNNYGDNYLPPGQVQDETGDDDVDLLNLNDDGNRRKSKKKKSRPPQEDYNL